jgi:hypothetical protein
MRDTLNQILSSPLDVGWKVLIVLTLLSVVDMLRTLLRRTKRLAP